jgi:hypothetical protein
MSWLSRLNPFKGLFEASERAVITGAVSGAIKVQQMFAELPGEEELKERLLALKPPRTRIAPIPAGAIPPAPDSIMESVAHPEAIPEPAREPKASPKGRTKAKAV